MPIRSGDEPLHARSPLRMRFWLAAWGLVWTTAGAVAFSLVGATSWAVLCTVLAALAAIDLVVIVRHLRQGPHYQPGRDVPPYEPVRDRPRGPGHRWRRWARR